MQKIGRWAYQPEIQCLRTPGRCIDESKSKLLLLAIKGIERHITTMVYNFQLLPEDIHIRANGRLFVSVTSVYSGENIIISNYSSKKELIDVSVTPHLPANLPSAARQLC